jgi:hypothetical protein
MRILPSGFQKRKSPAIRTLQRFDRVSLRRFGVRQLVGALVLYQSAAKAPHSKETSDFSELKNKI